MDLLVISLLVVASIVIGGNYLIERLLIRKLIDNYILPAFGKKDLIYLDIKPTGFFRFGDFKARDEVVYWPFLESGSPFRTLYYDIYYLDNGVENRVTVKADTFFFSIKKVVYSRSL